MIQLQISISDKKTMPHPINRDEGIKLNKLKNASKFT